MEKECPICGTLFETDTKIRKYCDKCRIHPEKGWKKMEYALADSKRRTYEPQLFEFNCAYCGKEHKCPSNVLHKLKLSGGSKRNWDSEDKYFCCEEHYEQAVHDHDKCAECGKSLKDSKDWNMYRKVNFCSEECKKQYSLDVARKKGYVHKCQNCNQEFIRFKEEAYFCSKDCMKEALLKGWRSPKSEETQKQKELQKVTAVLICKQCHEKFKRTFKNIIELNIAIRDASYHPIFCSKDCSAKYWDQLKIKQDKEKSLRGSQIKENVKQNSSHPDSICARCKVSYKDCERMQSNFRILPEGAHYDENGILTTCPKFKE